MAEHALSRECAEGRHRARRVRVTADNGMAQSTCRDCGCTLMRSQPMRRWYYSGQLGLSA
jgi:hypothetical protein